MEMQRDFASREALESYLREEFPFAAARDGSMSPLRGGRAEAERLLAAMEPVRYAQSRNFLDGSVTRLSPFIRHGVLSLHAVRQAAIGMAGGQPQRITKFISELAWRDYWQRLYAKLGDGIWEDREPAKTGQLPSSYAAELPPDVEAGTTGLRCMDNFAVELRQTGYLHNHSRMWLAAYLVHWRRVRWQAGAQWFLRHLLDGDPASNNLSWQWVASTFSHKPYIFNRENLEKYTAGRYCRDCRAACPFAASYADLSDRLFPGPTKVAP